MAEAVMDAICLIHSEHCWALKYADLQQFAQNTSPHQAQLIRFSMTLNLFKHRVQSGPLL